MHAVAGEIAVSVPGRRGGHPRGRARGERVGKIVARARHRGTRHRLEQRAAARHHPAGEVVAVGQGAERGRAARVGDAGELRGRIRGVGCWLCDASCPLPFCLLRSRPESCGV